jgi:hypothetical protein
LKNRRAKIFKEDAKIFNEDLPPINSHDQILIYLKDLPEMNSYENAFCVLQALDKIAMIVEEGPE